MTVEIKRSYVDGPHGQMHLRMVSPPAAKKPPLLCIHMSPMTGRVYENFLQSIGSDRPAVAFDTPGFGLSDPPPPLPTIEDYAEHLLAGMNALGLSHQFDVIGYHTGSLISVALARLVPERVRRVVMISAPIFPEEERKQFHGYYAPTTPQLDGSHIVKRWKGFVYHHLRPGTTLEEVADVFRDALLGGRIEWWGHRAAFEYDLESNLAAVRQPILIFNPGDDLDIQTRRAEGLAKTSLLLELPGWGHGFLDHHTGEAVSLVTAFLDADSGLEFANIVSPASAMQPRYPERIGSFPPASSNA